MEGNSETTAPPANSTLQAARRSLIRFLTRGEGSDRPAPIAPLIRGDTPTPLQDTMDANKPSGDKK